MERGGRQSSSIDSSLWISTLSPTSLNYYIMYADTLIDQVDEPIFEISILKFRDFVEQEYKDKLETCEEQEFLNNLFDEIFVNNVDSIKTLTVLKLCEAIIDVDLGSKITKASRIAQEIGSIKPTNDPQVFNSLGNILRWMNKILRVSIQLIIEPLIDTIWHWNDSSDNVALVGSFMLFSLLYELFPQCFTSHVRNIVETFIHGMQSDTEDVRTLAQKSMHLLLKDTSTGEKVINLLVTYVHKVIAESHPNEIYAVRDFMDILYSFKSNPQLFLETKELPFPFLKSTNKQQRLAGLCLMSFMLKLEPNYYNSFTYEKVLNCILPMLKKKSLAMGQGSINLGKIVFQREGKFSEQEKSILNSMRAIISKHIVCPPCVYAYCALLTANPKNFRKDLQDVFKLSISPFLIDGLYSLVNIFSNEAEFIYQQLIQYLNNILFNRNYTVPQIISCFEALLKLEMNKHLPLQLILQYSMFMLNPNLDIRKIAADFIIKCHNTNPTEDTAIRILTGLSREPNLKLQEKMISQMDKLPVVQSILPCLQNLFVTNSKRVKREVLAYCIKFAVLPAGLIVLNEFLSEQLINLNHEFSDKKKISITFLALCELTEDSNRVVAQNATNVLMPFVDHLFDIICSKGQKLSKNEIRILSQIIKLSPQTSKSEKLSPILLDCISISHSIKHIYAGLKLIYNTLFYTEIKDKTIIYELYHQLIDISMLSTANSEIHYLLLKIFSIYGPISPSIVNSIANLNRDQLSQADLSPFKYITSSTESDPLEAMIDASFSISITSIVNLLADESLATLHSPCIDTLISILRAGHEFSDESKEQLIKCVETTILHSNPTTISIFISNINVISNALKDSFKKVIPILIKFICQRWKQIDSLQLIQLCDMMMQNYRETVTPFIPSLAYLFVEEFENESPVIVQRIVDIILSFGASVNDVAHIVFPPILTWLYNNASDTSACNHILQNLVYILIDSHCDTYNASIIQTLISIAGVNIQLKDKCIHVLVAIAINVGSQFLLYIPALHDTFDIRSNQVMMKILPYLEEGFEYTQDILNFGKGPTRRTMSIIGQSPNASALTRTLSLTNFTSTLKLPSASFTEHEWNAWAIEAFMKLIRSSMSPAIASCEILVQKYPPLREVLFSLSIAMLYAKDESENSQNTMTTVFKTFFASDQTPQNLVSTFLSALEIVEFAGLECPIPLSLLSNQAIRAGRFSQGLRALEKLYESGDKNVIDELTKYNRIISRPFTYYNGGSTADIDTLVKWPDTKGMATIHDMSDSDSLISMKNPTLFTSLKFKELLNSTPKTSVHHITAEWGLFDMEGFAHDVPQLKTDDIDSLFYKAVYCILQEETSRAKKIIERVQRACADRIIPTLFHDYNRGFHNFSLLTRFSELEEIIYYHSLMMAEHSAKNDRMMDILVKKWQFKFSNYAEDLTVLQTSLQIRSLLYTDDDTRHQWKRLLQSAIDQKYIEFTEDLIPKLKSILSPQEKSFFHAQISYANSGFNDKLAMIDMDGETDPNFISAAECRIGGWYLMHGMLHEAQNHIAVAKQYDSNDAFVWKQWAIVNTAIFNKNLDECARTNAFEAFLKGLILTKEDHVSYLLRVISILFNDNNEKILDIFIEHFSRIPLHRFLTVMPHLVAHADTGNSKLGSIIQDLLCGMAEKHPHGVIQPMIANLSRLKKCPEILKYVYNKLKTDNPEITNDTMRIAKELIHIAILWGEKCNRYIQSIRSSFNDRNFDKVARLLKKLLSHIDKDPKTFYEVAFTRNFGSHLIQAKNWLENYEETKDDMLLANIVASFDFSTEQMESCIPQPPKVSLKDLSPEMDVMKDINVCMPGSYDPEKTPELISYVSKDVMILNNTNRKRLLKFISQSGKSHLYSLGGEGNSRLDVHIMQLFSFINNIVDHSKTILSTKVSLTTFNVLPLQGRIGLTGWIPHSETLDNAIQKHRMRHRQSVTAEYDECVKLAKDYESLDIDKKVKIFKKSLKATKGDDVKRLLLINSCSSKDWISRRIDYTVSLAIGSIVGYVIFLGNRTPKNILMNINTARIAHINFTNALSTSGQESCPSTGATMPFRLTRMLVNALELSRTDGSFMQISDAIFTLLQQNKEDLLSILDILVYGQTMVSNRKSGTGIKMIKGIERKLDGYELDSKEKLTVQKLISIATDKKNICSMPKYWNPWW